MTELALSEITIMDQGLCLIGLRETGGVWRSVRPMYPTGTAWPENSTFRRGDRLSFQLSYRPITSPHTEDLQSAGSPQLVGRLSEVELLGRLRSAEVATTSQELFGCNLKSTTSGSGVLWADPDEARRSICGCEFHWIQFFRDYEKWRAKVLLGSLETFENVALVDRDWREFLDHAGRLVGPENLDEQFLPFLNGSLLKMVYKHPSRFARFGLSRPFGGRRCWLMLDSLFPLPKREWLAEFAAGAGST